MKNLIINTVQLGCLLRRENSENEYINFGSRKEIQNNSLNKCQKLSSSLLGTKKKLFQATLAM